MATLPSQDRKELEQVLHVTIEETWKEKNQRKARSLAEFLAQIPPLPEYQPIDCPNRDPITNLPARSDSFQATPRQIFRLLFKDEYYSLLADNTNRYALLRREQEKVFDAARAWTDCSVGEMKIFIGILLYMGAKHSDSIEEYWSTARIDGLLPIVVDNMSRIRWQQIRRFLHVSNPLQDEEDKTSKNDSPWYYKNLPIVQEISEQWLRYRTPGSRVAVDEVMIKCEGRTKDNTMQPNKPIKKGYKLFALAERGYCYGYSYYSANQKSGSKTGVHGLRKLKELSITGTIVVDLLTRLLPEYRTAGYNIFLDNYFTTLPLALYLKNLGIAVTGTAKGDPDWPILLMEMKNTWRTQIPGNFHAAIVQNEVLCSAWQDNNMVLALTTAYSARNSGDKILVLRKRPGKTSTNAAVMLPLFGDLTEKELEIPIVYHEYNQWMGPVDQFNQLVAYYCSQKRTQRVWMPLFHWLLDASACNSFGLWKTTVQKKHKDHKQFLLSLINDLIQEGVKDNDIVKEQLIRKRKAYVATNQKPRTGPQVLGHSWVKRPTRQACIWCRKTAEVTRTKRSRFGQDITNSANQKPPTKTQWGCGTCIVPLCKYKDCWEAYHTSSLD